MTHTLHLSDYPTMRAAYDARNDLLIRFIKAHKRSEKVAIFVGSSGTANPVNQLTVHYAKEHEAEAQWFKDAVSQ